MYVAAAYLVLDLVLGTLGFFGVRDRVAHFAHLGGFVAGVGWAYALNLMAEAAKDQARYEATEMASAGLYRAAGTRLEMAIEKRPDDPHLHKEAAVYFGLHESTRSRAIFHWNQALRLWLEQDQHDVAAQEWSRARRGYDPSTLA